MALDGDESEGSYFKALGSLAAHPEVKVRVSAGRRDAPETERELAISKLLGGTGSVPTFFETQTFEDVTFMLTESPGMTDLGMLLEEREEADPDPTKPLLSMEEFLPLMVDMLRAAVHMEKLGIAHGDLMEEKVYLLGGRYHAVITDFRASCVAGTSDEEVGCSGVGDVMGSALRHAPEMEDDHPNGVSNNVWQLGLVFARMLFGGGAVPTEAVVREQWEGLTTDDAVWARYLPHTPSARDAYGGSFLEWLDSSPGGRQHIRDIIRQDFAIEKTPGFRKLFPAYKDVLSIIAGMLEKNPRNRLSAFRAWEAAQRVARKRKVPLRTRRRPTALPEDWYQDWQ